MRRACVRFPVPGRVHERIPLERNAVEKAVRLCEGNMSRAAQMLGITRYSLYRKLEKLGL